MQTWQKPGDLTDYQRISSARQFSSKDIRDASFVRFRNLQVGYTFGLRMREMLQEHAHLGTGAEPVPWTKWTGFDRRRAITLPRMSSRI